jgi:hypothetical protein
LGSYNAPVDPVDSATDVHDAQEAVNVSQKSPAFPSISRRIAWENRESPTKVNQSQSNASESKSMEDDRETQTPPNIVPFPAAHADTVEHDTNSSEQAVLEATKQVAAILNLPVTDNLARVVADYLGDPSLSLLGEADAAREWIEDPRRNRKRVPLTPAFFRRWLKREHEAIQRGYAPAGAFLQKTSDGTRPLSVHRASTTINGTGPPVIHGTSAAEQAENPYHAFVSARAKEVMHRRLSRQEEVRHEASP